MQLPTFIQIEPVGQCNLRCQMCSLQFRHDGPPYGPLAFLDIDLFKRILDQLPALKELQLQGLGEPMMHPRFFDMVSYAVARGLEVTTNSNLTLLNERRAERCVTSGLHYLHVSIDGATAQTYERIRVRSHFERVVANLERLVAIRKRLGSNLPRITLVVVIMKQNLHELPALVRFAHRWSLEKIFVQHLCHDFGEESLPSHYHPMRDFVREETLLNDEPQRVAYYFDAARRAAEELDIDLRLPRTQPHPHPPGTPGPQRCNWPWSGTYISYSGYAMPCCMVSTPDRVHFGNVVEQSVQETWQNSSYQEFRSRLASEEPPDICRSCAVYNGTF